MSDYIDELKEGIRPQMGTCPICKRRFIVSEGMECDCDSDGEDRDEEVNK